MIWTHVTHIYDSKIPLRRSEIFSIHIQWDGPNEEIYNKAIGPSHANISFVSYHDPFLNEKERVLCV